MRGVRGVRRAIEVPRPPEEVWAWWQDMANWDAFFNALAGYKALRHRVASGSGPTLVVAADTPSGRARFLWKVTDWEPPRRLSLSLDPGRKSAGSLMGLTLRFDGPKAGQPGNTRVECSLRIILRNRLLELASLLLPIHWVYATMLDRALRHLSR